MGIDPYGTEGMPPVERKPWLVMMAGSQCICTSGQKSDDRLELGSKLRHDFPFACNSGHSLISNLANCGKCVVKCQTCSLLCTYNTLSFSSLCWFLYCANISGKNKVDI